MTSEVVASIIVAMTMIVALVAMLTTMSVAKARLRHRAHHCARLNECPASNDTHSKGKTP